MTLEEMQNLPEKEQEKLYIKLKGLRHKAKTTNYSATYNAYPPKIAKTAGIPLDEAQTLWETYWERNWSIEKIADECTVKELDDEWWLYNPVSKLWYSLRHPKDRFSTLNQGTGSYCFDTYLGFVLQSFRSLVGQFHDEWIFDVPEEQVKDFKQVVQEAIQNTNKFLKLNRELEVGLEAGNNYGEIH